MGTLAGIQLAESYECEMAMLEIKPEIFVPKARQPLTTS